MWTSGKKERMNYCLRESYLKIMIGWFYAHGGSLCDDGSLAYPNEIKDVTEKLLKDVADKSSKGKFVPDRENDELTVALNKLQEDTGVSHGRLGLLIASIDTYRSRQRQKKQRRWIESKA